jgi:hypothetical protein
MKQTIKKKKKEGEKIRVNASQVFVLVPRIGQAIPGDSVLFLHFGWRKGRREGCCVAQLVRKKTFENSQKQKGNEVHKPTSLQQQPQQPPHQVTLEKCSPRVPSMR